MQVPSNHYNTIKDHKIVDVLISTSQLIYVGGGNCQPINMELFHKIALIYERMSSDELDWLSLNFIYTTSFLEEIADKAYTV